jgi:hypothetical protein
MLTERRVRCLSQASPHCGGNDPQLSHQLIELIQI